MSIKNLKQFKGKITFWGEIDRQSLLTRGSVRDITAAVSCVYDNLYADGGCIAQCEIGSDSRFENVAEVYACWDKLTRG